MTITAFKLPAGIKRNGTAYQSKGRWFDASLVRCFESTIRPIGGWAEMVVSEEVDTELVVRGVPRTILGWRDNDGNQVLAVGTNQKLYGQALGKLHDLTPVSFIPGQISTTTSNSGGSASAYGDGLYGSGPYGKADPAQQSVLLAAVWHLDTFGQFLIACCSPNDGKLYSWDRDINHIATRLDNSPPLCRGVVVTPERFIVALGSRGKARRIDWPDQETLDQWINPDTGLMPDGSDPAVGHSAGGFDLEGSGTIVAGRRAKGETLIWTDDDLHAMRYIGAPLIYSFEKVGAKCGLVSPNGVVVIDTQAVWMGQRQFHVYDGYVKPLPCEVSDFIFSGDPSVPGSGLNWDQRQKVSAFSISRFGEIWWLYPSANSDDCDRYVIWNYRENHWMIGEIDRTCGTDAGALAFPVLASRTTTSAPVGDPTTIALDTFTDTDDTRLSAHTPNTLVTSWIYPPEDDSDGGVHHWRIESNKLTSVGWEHVGAISNLDIEETDYSMFVDAAYGAVDYTGLRGIALWLNFAASATVIPENIKTHPDGVRVSWQRTAAEVVKLVVDTFDGSTAWDTPVTTADIAIDIPFPVGTAKRLGVTVDGDRCDVWMEPAGGGSRTTYGSFTIDARYQDGLHKCLGFADSITNPLFIPTQPSISRWEVQTPSIVPNAPAGNLFEHEKGSTHLDRNDAVIRPFLDSGPVELGDGDEVMYVSQIVPDERNLGDVEFSVVTKFYPTDVGQVRGPFPVRSLTDVRWSATMMNIRVRERVAGDWRLGDIKLDVTSAGRRGGPVR